MNCLVNVKVTYKNIKEIGGSIILTIAEFNELVSKMKESKNIIIDRYEDKDDELHIYFREDKEFKQEAIGLLMDKNNIEALSEILRLGNPYNKSGSSIAHILARRGYKFTVDDILKLGNPVDACGSTIGHWMAYKKSYKLTDIEIFKLGNPSNDFGKTIFDAMIYTLEPN